jgi:hypothetical protein
MVRAARALRRAGVLTAKWGNDAGVAFELALTPQETPRAQVVALPRPRKLSEEQQERLAQQRAALRAEAEVYGRMVGDV